MSDVVKLVVGDELPAVMLSLTDENTGADIDLSAPTTTVTVKFHAAGDATTLSTISTTKVGDGSGGQVTFDFTGGELAVAAGSYEGDILIDFNGAIQTVYDTIRFRVRAAVT